MSVAQLSVGSLVGDRYRIVGELGRGAMGVVFAVHDDKLAPPRLPLWWVAKYFRGHFWPSRGFDRQ